MHVLLIEDDNTLRQTLARTLTRRGITVSQCADGAQALSVWQGARADVVVLDLSLPGLDGLEVLSQARQAGLRTPVIVTTARGTVGDRILGLNVGADDYLAKPFDLDELEARVRALARRAAPPSRVGVPGAASAAGAANAPPATSEGLPPADAPGLGEAGSGRITLDEVSGALYVDKRLLELSPRETAMMRALMQRPGLAVSKDRLFEAVFGDEPDVAMEAVEVVAYRLRKKLKDGGANARLVTLRGLGYLLQDGTHFEG
jgi:two-component system, OmpR family, response regulator TctD